MLSGTDLSSRLSFDVQGVAALRMKAATGDPGTLKAAAKQFEAMLVQTMLKTMRVSHFTSDGDVFGDSSSLKLYQELLDQQWAQSITAGKGLGLADMIVKSLPAAASDPALPPGEAAKAAAALAPARVLPASAEPGAYTSDPAYVEKLQGAIRGIPSPSLGQTRCDRGQVLTAAAVN